MIAGAIGTCVGNPLTFPFIWASTYELGHIILRRTSRRRAGAARSSDLLHKSWDQLLPLIEPMLSARFRSASPRAAIVYLRCL